MKPAADRSLRIDGAPAATVEFRFDGRRIVGRPGESIASALWAAGIRTLRHSPGRAAPRGVFCNVGVCQECVVVVEGRHRPACTTPVAPGLDVASIALDPDIGA
jgi:D-hydroxyproline dehydrogenase subunit gamma